jgi:hypothetical protein
MDAVALAVHRAASGNVGDISIKEERSESEDEPHGDDDDHQAEDRVAGESQPLLASSTLNGSEPKADQGDEEARLDPRSGSPSAALSSTKGDQQADQGVEAEEPASPLMDVEARSVAATTDEEPNDTAAGAGPVTEHSEGPSKEQHQTSGRASEDDPTPPPSAPSPAAAAAAGGDGTGKGPGKEVTPERSPVMKRYVVVDLVHGRC